MKFRVFIGGIIALAFLGTQSCKENRVSVFKPVEHPFDNASSPEKIEFGRKLFFDKRLSKNNTVACASCHIPELAFTDGKRVSDGVSGGMTSRNSPTLLNIAYSKTLMFEAQIPSLEMQAIVPIQEHVEMDMKMNELIKKLRAIPEYNQLAQSIFNRDFDAWVLTRSISCFERSLISNNSRFDQYYYHQETASLNNSEIKGWKIFSEKLYCTECHKPPYFTNFEAENNGLYSDYGNDKGRFRIDNDSSDIGKFKVPSLRNLELTSPYMHDGSIITLENVINHYSNGGRNHQNQSDKIQPFSISNKEKTQLIDFLKSLTDTSYMKDF